MRKDDFEDDHPTQNFGCDKQICVFHVQNMKLIERLEEKLSEISTALISLDRDIVRITTSSKIRIGIFGTIITAMLALGGGICGYLLNDFTALKTIVQAVKEKRIENSQDIISIKDDIREIKQQIGFDSYNRK